MATELVPGRSAGRYDLWRRALNLGSIVLPLIVGVIMAVAGAPGAAIAVVVIVLAVGGFVASLVAGHFTTQTMRREMEAGYSTLLDVTDFELRDERTLELLRASNVVPDNPGKRSLVAGLFRVKPGTVLAKRIDDEKRPTDEA